MDLIENLINLKSIASKFYSVLYLFKLSLIVGIICFGSFGCHSKQLGDNNSDIADLQSKKIAFETSLPPNKLIGEVVWADRNKKKAVILLMSKNITVDKNLVSRNISLQPTAIFEPTDIKRNRSLGVIISKGFPNVGDQVVIPDTAYLNNARMKL